MRWLAVVALLLALAACPESGKGGPHESHDFVAAAMGLSGGIQCEYRGSCNGIVSVDCKSITDGPAYFFDEVTLELISCCGGCCLAPDPQQAKVCQTQCPPPAWTCSR